MLKFDRARARLLLADDDADMREYVRKVASRQIPIWKPLTMATPPPSDAQRAPDLVVSDVMMPKLDGFDMLKAIRADERTAAFPVILTFGSCRRKFASKESRAR